MKIKRLLRLAKRLDRVKPERFNINKWVGDSWEGKQDLSCGTSACALGWATTIPEFSKAGLKLYRPNGALQAFVAFSGKGGIKQPYAHSQALTNAAAFFGLDDETAREIFWPDSYPMDSFAVTPRVVARRIRAIVRAHRSR